MISEERLKAVMGAVLETDPRSIGPDSSTDNMPGWDSLRHMNLILALEEEFGVTIADEDVSSLTSYPLIKLVISDLLTNLPNAH